MSSWTAQDRMELGSRQAYARMPNLKFTVAPATRPLPPSAALRPAWAHQEGYREWGYQADDPGADRLVGIEWPSGWEVVEALLADRGLRGEPSTAGRPAASMLARLGSLTSLGMLLDSEILERLYKLGTAKSMTWFRDRTRDLAIAAKNPRDDETALGAIERVLTEMTVRPSEEEQPRATVEQLQAVLGRNREATRAWIRWAEANDLVVRGARVKCNECGADSWRQLGELAPPVVCRGCGRHIKHPYPEGELKFHYRASEPLLRVIEADAMPHLLAMRFFCTLWRPSFERSSTLYGAYPGVDIYELESNARAGEADVLLVTSSGELIPGECKRRGAGLNEAELSKLDRLTERLEAPWSFVATLDWAQDCPAIWADCLRFAPHPRPRLALTAELVLQPNVFWPLGTNIFEWNPADADARATHHAQFVDSVVRWAEFFDTGTVRI
jgi:hypothetical protein